MKAQWFASINTFLVDIEDVNVCYGLPCRSWFDREFGTVQEGLGTFGIFHVMSKLSTRGTNRQEAMDATHRRESS